MNEFKLIKPYRFKDNSEHLFKVHCYECGLPSKIAGLLRFENDEFTVRFCDDWILCVGHGSMLFWKGNTIKKTTLSSCIEYQIPHCVSGHRASQVLIMGGTASIMVTNDGAVRYWPRLIMPLEYLDDRISGINHDECLLVNAFTDGVVVVVFRSMRIVVIDLTRTSELGLSIKTFTQPRGFINGIGSYLSSFIVNQSIAGDSFKNIKVNNLLSEETELLVMVDNNIDSLSLDVLFNGHYKKEILSHDFWKKSIFDALFKDTIVDFTELTLIFENFDLCQNIIYALVQVKSKEGANLVLVTYNRKLGAIDSVVSVDVDLVGKGELSVVVDDCIASDEPCLLVTIKDDHNIYIVEVLTGIVKSHLNTNTRSTHRSIIGWTCPSLTKDHETIVVILTSSKQLIAIKHNVNHTANMSIASRFMDTELEFNLGDASFSDLANISRISFTKPSALSTPLPHYEQRGHDIFIKTERDSMNTSMPIIETVDKMVSDTTEFGTFKKGVVLYWFGYQSHARRVVGPIIERAQQNNDISLPLFVLQIVREIMDEYPAKDPRWSNTRTAQETNGFLYSNKWLLLPQQLQAKKEALQSLVLMLREVNVDLFGSLGNVAPMSVCQSLLMQRLGSSLPIYGESQVTWPLAHCIGFGMELLEFARLLNEVITSENGEEINQIMAKCCQHVMAVQKKLSPMDVISQEISLIPRFIHECADYLNEKKFANMDSGNAKDICTLLAKMLTACLTSSLLCRQQFEESFLAAHFLVESYPKTTAPSCWITEIKPIGILDSVLAIIHRLLLLSRSTDFLLFQSTIDVVTVLLDCFKYRVDWMEEFGTNTEELKRLKSTFTATRSNLIEKIVDDERGIEIGLVLADRFADFHWLTHICEILDNKSKSRDTCHLEQYLTKWSNDGLSEFVLGWYQEKLQQDNKQFHGKLLAKIQLVLEKIQRIELPNASTRMDSSCNSHVIGKFLAKEEVQTTRWLHDIETGDFSQAALTLSRLAEMETKSVTRRKTLFGLAKLSYLANMDMTTEKTDKAVDIVNKYMTLLSFQEDIPFNVMESQLALPENSLHKPIIRIEQLVKLFLEAVATRNDEKYFVRALELMDFCWMNLDVARISVHEWELLIQTVWTQVIGHDDWSTMTLDMATQSSTFVKVYKAAVDKGLSMTSIEPDLDMLFNTETSLHRPFESDVAFMVKGVLESLTTVANERHYNDMNCD